jgi:hypothetical protein
VAITLPNTPITTSGPLEFCDGYSVQIVGAPLFGANYQWYKDGLPAANGNGSTVIATESGRYVLYTAMQPCSGYSAELSVTVFPIPVVTITHIGNGVLEVPSGYRLYRWYCDGQIVGTNSNFHNTGKYYGYYYVTVIDSNGCEGTSSLFDYYAHLPRNIHDHNNLIEVRVYPNPSNGLVTIEASEPIHYDVLGLDGKLMLSEQTEKCIDMSSFASGVYLVRVYNHQGYLISVYQITKE